MRELRGMFAQASLAVTDPTELGIPESPVEDELEKYDTFEANALAKARYFMMKSGGLPALADDSGLCVDALDGAPGLYSARYAGPHGDAQANIAKLLEAMKGVPRAQRTAHFIAVIVLLRHAGDPQPIIAEGRWSGRILDAPRGDGGFGYDPVFLDPDNNLSAAQFEPAIKHRLSHRGRALRDTRRKPNR
jgi:XTP/dITP diphosphohydrolase